MSPRLSRERRSRIDANVPDAVEVIVKPCVARLDVIIFAAALRGERAAFFRDP
jgi:hypothetical protein